MKWRATEEKKSQRIEKRQENSLFAQVFHFSEETQNLQQEIENQKKINQNYFEELEKIKIELTETKIQFQNQKLITSELTASGPKVENPVQRERTRFVSIFFLFFLCRSSVCSGTKKK